MKPFKKLRSKARQNKGEDACRGWNLAWAVEPADVAAPGDGRAPQRGAAFTPLQLATTRWVRYVVSQPVIQTLKRAEARAPVRRRPLPPAIRREQAARPSFFHEHRPPTGGMRALKKLVERLKSEKVKRPTARVRCGRTAGFPTCCIADFPIGRPFRSRVRPVAQQSAGWETRDTADWEVCGTREKPVRHHHAPARAGRSRGFFLYQRPEGVPVFNPFNLLTF